MIRYFLPLCILSLAACGPFELGTGAAPGTDNSATGSLSTSLQAMDILNQNCTSCHGTSSGPSGVYGLQNVDHMISAGLIVPGSPSQSSLYNEIASGSMPPSRPLTADQQNTIRDWIVSINSNTGSTPTPSPTPSPSVTPKPSPSPSPSPSPTTPPVDIATFSYLEKNILGPKCTACHSGSGGSGGYRFDTYNGTMKAVNTTTPTSSKLYTITHSGSMPPSSSQRLNSSQENLILQWVEEGAKNN